MNQRLMTPQHKTNCLLGVENIKKTSDKYWTQKWQVSGEFVNITKRSGMYWEEKQQVLVEVSGEMARNKMRNGK